VIESGLLAARYQMATAQLELGNMRGAIDVLTEILGSAPDEAPAHALLALVLFRQKRLHAARHEARLALAADPELTMAHVVLGLVAVMQRRPKEAERHFDDALALEPGDVSALRAKASLRVIQRRPDEALALLDEARRSEPDDPATLADIGTIHLRAGRLSLARRAAQGALELAPEHQDALVLMGRILLHDGEVEEAREHALWALRRDPSDPDALRFLADVKMRESVPWGMWWRYSVWMQTLGETRQIFVLLGAWVLYRVAVLAAGDLQQPGLATGMQLAWLALVAYTWLGPTWFARMVQRELAPVRLRPG